MYIRVYDIGSSIMIIIIHCNGKYYILKYYIHGDKSQMKN